MYTGGTIIIWREGKMESRKEKAIRLFKEGYNCSQSVFAAFADMYDMDEQTALKISTSFGAGMGRMREVCGTVSGMCLVAGMETGTTDGKDVDGKKHNYDVVQQLADAFKEKNGSIICKELLGLVPKAQEERKELEAASFTDTTPEARTEQYYKKRPCVELVGDAVEILETVLFNK